MEDDKIEVLQGITTIPPSPLPRHSRVQRTLSNFIGGPYDDNYGRGGPGDGWWILPEIDIKFSEDDKVRPDIAGWKRTRIPNPWDMRPITIVPDWICEILSPSNASDDRVKKRSIYALYEVPFYWIIDPEERIIEALRFNPFTKKWIEIGVYDQDSISKIEPFEDIVIEVGRIFPPNAC
jgi:Uma2 family endonuclease